MKSLVTRNAHVKYESSIYTGSEVMDKVNFVQAHARANVHTEGYGNSSLDIRPGELNTALCRYM